MERALAFAPDRHEIPLQSRSVSRLYVDAGVDIQFFEDGSETAIRIDGPLAVVTENPRPFRRFDDEESYTPAMGVFGKIVVSGSALRKERMLEVVFHPGVWFQVEPQPNPDGWGPAGSKGVVIVCMPGSEMAIWFGPRRKYGPESYDAYAAD